MKYVRLQIAVPYLLLAIAFALLAARAPFSFSWADESFYVALADRFYDGAAPFIDEWHPTQLYVPLLAPFYALYMLVVGSPHGIILYFRYIYLLISFLTAIVAYRVLSREFGRFAACSIALCYLFYLRANIQGPSCYSLCATFFMLALICALCTWTRIRDELDDPDEPGAARVLLPLLGGAFIALSALCNIYVIAVFAIACLIALICCAKAHEMRHFIPFAWAIAGVIIVASVYLLYLFMHASPADIIANIGNISLGNGEHLTAVERILDYLSFFPVNKVGFAGVCLLTAFLIVWRILKREMSSSFKLIILIIDCLLLAGTVMTAFFVSVHPNKAFIAFVEFAIPVYLLCDNLHPREHPELLFFWLPGIFLSIAWQLACNTETCNMVIGFSIAAYGAIITVLDTFDQVEMPYIDDDESEDEEEDVLLGEEIINARMMRISHKIACITVLLLTIATIVIRIGSVYLDCTWKEMNTTIWDGPAAGLITSSEHAADYEDVRELMSNIDDNSSVWIGPMAPWAYLECAGGCGAPSAWNTFPNQTDLDTYYDTQKHKKPKWILLTSNNLGEPVCVVAGKQYKSPVLKSYYEYDADTRDLITQSGEYKPIISNDSGTLYKRTEFSSINEG